MGLLIGILVLVLLVSSIVTLFLRADPSSLASSVRLAGPLGLLFAGALIAAAGRPGLAGAAVLAAVVWYMLQRRKRRPARKRRSIVRTAALEVELDHKTGALEGLVLAGRSEGKMLGSLDLSELTLLHGELVSDPESRQLLETYLDSRFSAWRDDTQPDGHERLSIAPGAGAMTKEEAYKILGLEAGAAAADVRKAHRRLMQRLHPDIDRTSFLAARIDKAKDVLLSDHD